MIRRAFTMRLKPDSLDEYKHHHDNIWPELVAEIERAGIASITTFQRDLDLFLVSEIADEAAWDKLWTSEVHRRWADVMQPLMHLREDGIVDAGELTEVFHLTTNGTGEPSVSAVVVVEPPSDTTMEILELLAEAADEASLAPPAAEPSTAEPAMPPAAKLHRKMAARQVKKAASKKTNHLKKSPAKKTKHKPAKRPKARTTKKAVKKPAKKSAPKKAKKSAKKKKKGGKKRG
jgi:L-rhamnose mutarotase